MTGAIERSRIITDLPPLVVESMATPYPEFEALHHLPAHLGQAAHTRLEELMQMPVASDDAAPLASDDVTGQREGSRLGDVIGREREFTRNLPKIEANVKAVAESRGVSPSEINDEVTDILTGSGIGKAMHRTLEGPIDGGRAGVRDYVDRNGVDGIFVYSRQNIANWGGRRHEQVLSFLGGISRQALGHVDAIAYAGSQRHYGPGELWRPELQPHVSYDEEGKPTSSLTEATAGELIYAPDTRRVLGNLGLGDQVDVLTVAVTDPDAKGGDDVVRALIARYGERMQNKLIVEVGNAPAGYTQLEAGLLLVRELGIEPEQFVAVTDSVDIVHPDHFAALDQAQKSRVQNAATGLNSLNGWLATVAHVNRYAQERRATA